MTRKTQLFQSLALLLCLLLASCTSSNPPTFISYVQKQSRLDAAPPEKPVNRGQSKGIVWPQDVASADPKSKSGSAFDVTRAPRPTDALALNYANYIETMFRATATGARMTREGSDVGLAGLSGAIGGARTLAIGAAGASSLGLAGGGIVALRTIFDAKGRAVAYSEAAERIHAAIKDYGAYNLNDVSTDHLTPNGWTLVNVVQSNIDIVNKILNGHLPSPQALEQASEPMSKAGAAPQATGSNPANNISGTNISTTTRLPKFTGPTVGTENNFKREKAKLAKRKEVQSKTKDVKKALTEVEFRFLASTTNPKPEIDYQKIMIAGGWKEETDKAKYPPDLLGCRDWIEAQKDNPENLSKMKAIAEAMKP